MRFNEKGQELPDPTPMEIPAGMKRPETLSEQIRRMIRTDLSQAAGEAGAETFEEANDFDIEEDEPETIATHHELREEVVDEVKRVNREAAERRAADDESDTDSEPQKRGARIQEETDSDSNGDDLPSPREDSDSRSSKSRPRSAERRPGGRREHAETDEEESGPRRGPVKRR